MNDDDIVVNPAEVERHEINKLLSRFTSQNTRFAKDNESHIEQIKINRSYVRGIPLEPSVLIDEGKERQQAQKLQTNLIFSTIQALVPHIYAKDPDISASPTRKVTKIDGDETEDPAYDQNKLLGETLELVTQKSTQRAGIKKKGKKIVRASMSSRVGMLKVGYSIDRNQDPLLKSKIKTVEDDIERLAILLDQIEEEDERLGELTAKQEEYDNLLASLHDETNRVISEGAVLDFIPIENFRWDMSRDADEMREGDWMAHHTVLTKMDAMAMGGLAETEDDGRDRVKSWKPYQAKENDEDGTTEYKPISGNQLDGVGDDDCYVRVWERWDRLNNSVYTWVEGDTEFLLPPKHPRAIGQAWYPFYPLILFPLDGQSWPICITELMIPLQLEYDELRKQHKEHRKAALPFVIYDKTLVDGEELQADLKEVDGRTFVGVNANGATINQVFGPGPAVTLNNQNYDTTPIRVDLQRLAGLGDAASGAVVKAKTLGEAQIEQQELGARTGTNQDEVEEWLTLIYTHIAGLCLLNMTDEEVRKIAGDSAVWPWANNPETGEPFPEEQAEQIKNQVINGFDIVIKAGSAGRPNKSRDQQQWFENIDYMLQLIERIEFKRDQGIPDSENSYYRIFEMTLKILEMTEDVTTILPKRSQSLIDQMLQELVSLMQANQLDPTVLQQLPSIQQYMQTKQAQQPQPA